MKRRVTEISCKARGKSDMTIKQAWAALAEMKINQKSAKNEVLMAFLTGGDWQNKLLTVTETVTRENEWK